MNNLFNHQFNRARLDSARKFFGRQSSDQDQFFGRQQQSFGRQKYTSFANYTRIIMVPSMKILSRHGDLGDQLRRALHSRYHQTIYFSIIFTDII